MSDNIYLQRLLAREAWLKQWLTEEAKDTEKIRLCLEKIFTALDAIDENKLIATLKTTLEESLKASIHFCEEVNERIDVLVFEWSSFNWGFAYSCAMSECNTNDALSNTDLGPDDAPGIETELEWDGVLVEFDHELDISDALQPWYEGLEQEWDALPYQLCRDNDSACLELFQIALYKAAMKASEDLLNSDAFSFLGKNEPFFLVLQRHERWPVPVMRIG